MYVSNLIANQRSLTLKASRNFTTTISIIAGSRSHDNHGARIMRKIKELSNDEVKFIGVGGFDFSLSLMNCIDLKCCKKDYKEITMMLTNFLISL